MPSPRCPGHGRTTTGEAPSRRAVAATLTTGGGAELALRRGLVLDVGGAAGAYAFREGLSAQSARWMTTVTFVARLGLGYRW